MHMYAGALSLAWFVRISDVFVRVHVVACLVTLESAPRFSLSAELQREAARALS